MNSLAGDAPAAEDVTKQPMKKTAAKQNATAEGEKKKVRSRSGKILDAVDGFDDRLLTVRCRIVHPHKDEELSAKGNTRFWGW